MNINSININNDNGNNNNDNNDNNNDNNDNEMKMLLNEDKLGKNNNNNIDGTNNYTNTVYVISLYWIVSISMVYLNKVLLANDDASIPAPLLITWFQCVITCGICYILGILGDIDRKNGIISIYSEYPSVSFEKWKRCLDVLPLSIVFILMITLNNICLKYVTVSFYNIARSLSLVFNVIFTYLILGTNTSLKTCCTLLIVVFGFIIGIEGELDFSMFGTLAGVLASLFVSLNSIYTSSTLPKVDNNKSLLLFYNNYNASILFVPLIIIFEYSIIISHLNKFFSLIFWFSMVISGIMGFAIGLVTVMQVKATSPLTHNISGTAKAAVQSLLAFYIWGNKATSYGIIGLFAVLIGSGLYTYTRI